MENKVDNPSGCLKFATFLFVFAILATVFGFIFEGKSYTKEFLSEEDGISAFEYLRLTFVLFIFALGFYVYNKNK